MKSLLALSLMFLCSCEALATLERLDRQVADAIEAGELTDDELREVAATTDTLQGDVDRALSSATKTAAGMLGAGPLADAAGVVLAGVLGLNTVRNRNRRKRGERVDVTPPSV